MQNWDSAETKYTNVSVKLEDQQDIYSTLSEVKKQMNKCFIMQQVC